MALTNGLFRVQLDFEGLPAQAGAVLDGKASWLEIGVRPGGSSEPYTLLFPRQKLTPTPYAIFAQHDQWSLIGVPVGFAGDMQKADIVELEKKPSKADAELSLARLVEKAATPAKVDDGPGTTAVAAPCTPAVSCSTNDPAFAVTNTGIGHGIEAHSRGTANNASGVVGVNDAGGWGVSGFTNTGFAGVFGYSGNNGVFGLTSNQAVNAAGVFGQNDNTGTGVFGNSIRDTNNAATRDVPGGIGVFGRTDRRDRTGVLGRYDGADSQGGWGVFGFSPRGFAGVFGSGGGYGVFGQTGNTTAENAAGVYG